MRVLTAENRSMTIADMTGGAIEAMVLRRHGGEWDYVIGRFDRLATLRGPLQRVGVAGGCVELPSGAWLVAGERDTGEIEVVRCDQAIRQFELVTLNPLTSSMLGFSLPTPVGWEPDAIWAVPAVDRDVFVVYPVHDGVDPPCVLIAVDPPRKTTVLSVADLI